MINKDIVQKLHVSDEFRLLLSSLDIPIEIDDNLPKLKKLAKAKKWEDTARAMGEIRNSIVHSNSKRRKEFNDAMYETWNLGLWYLELSLLKLVGTRKNIAIV
jgi:hypothetical protein